MSRYNEDKKLYVVYRPDTHEYLENHPDYRYNVWSFFCSARLWDDKSYAEESLKCVKEYVPSAELLEGSLTKWAFKQPLETSP